MLNIKSMYMNVLIKNASGTYEHEPPHPYNTWIEYWEVNANFKLNPNQPYKCPACGKSFYRSDFDGCHVQKVGDPIGKMYIIPLCSGCNHRNDFFLVDENLLVPAP